MGNVSSLFPLPPPRASVLCNLGEWVRSPVRSVEQTESQLKHVRIWSRMLKSNYYLFVLWIQIYYTSGIDTINISTFSSSSSSSSSSPWSSACRPSSAGSRARGRSSRPPAAWRSDGGRADWAASCAPSDTRSSKAEGEEGRRRGMWSKQEEEEKDQTNRKRKDGVQNRTEEVPNVSHLSVTVVHVGTKCRLMSVRHGSYRVWVQANILRLRKQEKDFIIQTVKKCVYTFYIGFQSNSIFQLNDFKSFLNKSILAFALFLKVFLKHCWNTVNQNVNNRIVVSQTFTISSSSTRRLLATLERNPLLPGVLQRVVPHGEAQTEDHIHPAGERVWDSNWSAGVSRRKGIENNVSMETWTHFFLMFGHRRRTSSLQDILELVGRTGNPSIWIWELSRGRKKRGIVQIITKQKLQQNSFWERERERERDYFIHPRREIKSS